MSRKYQAPPPTAPAPDDTLEQLVRQGAREILPRAPGAAGFPGPHRFTDDLYLKTGIEPGKTAGPVSGCDEATLERFLDELGPER